MRRASLLLLALLGACARPAPPADAAAPALPADAPAAQDLFAAAAAAIGDPAALEALHSMVGQGQLLIPSQGITATLEMTSAAPGDLRSALDFPGVGLMMEGVYQGVAWAMDPMGGPRIKEGVEAAQATRGARFDLEWRLAELYPVAETVAVEQLNGEPVWAVRAVPEDGPEELLYFRVSDGMHVGSRIRYVTLMGEINTTLTFGDHRSVSGVQVPFLSTVEQGPVQSLIQMRAVAFNPDPLPSLEPPPEILALLAPSAP